MTRIIHLAMAGAAVLAAAAAQSEAAPITNGFGLSSPAQTITFDEFVFPAGTSITTEYSSLGVTFSPNLVYDAQLGGFPNVSGHRLGNFNPIVDPFFIVFSTPQTEAAFAMVTNPGTSTFTALIGSTVVSSFSAATDTTSSTNFFGFTGIVFDTIRIDVGGSNSAMLLDNLQSGTAAVIPEPTSLGLFGIGAGVMAVAAVRPRRRRKSRA